MQYAEKFNQNLSSWCVSKLIPPPNFFALGGALDIANTPDWGNCPP
jgi:hypothetical protein